MRKTSEIITKVNLKFGVPVGRPNVGEEPVTITSGNRNMIFKKNQIKVYDKKVTMCSCCGSYDKGGAYWGRGGEVRVRFTDNLTYIEFYRIEKR